MKQLEVYGDQVMTESISVNEFWEKYLNGNDNEKMELVMKHVIEPIAGILRTARVQIHGITASVPYETRKKIVAEIITSYFDSLIRYLQQR